MKTKTMLQHRLETLDALNLEIQKLETDQMSRDALPPAHHARLVGLKQAADKYARENLGWESRSPTMTGTWLYEFVKTVLREGGK